MHAASCRPPRQSEQGLSALGTSSKPDFGRLPRKPWLRVLQYLDAESRLNVGDIGPNFKQLAVDNETLLETVRCDANGGAASLKWLLALGRCTHVRKLCLNNCTVARPSELLECVVMCTFLTELRCVRCPLDVHALLSIKSLPLLQRLDWTLHCDHQLRRCFVVAEVGRFSFALCARLSDMYVEVESDDHPSFRFLQLTVLHCPRLRRLHVHPIRDNHGTSLQQCALLASSLRKAQLGTFVFTTDVDVTPMCRHTEDVPQWAFVLESRALACANVVINYKDGVSNCMSLRDLVRSSRGPGDQEQIVLVVEYAEAAHSLIFAASAFGWAQVKAMTLVSTIMQARDVAGSPRLCDGIATLLHFCSNLTELNLNAFHFPEGAVFSHFPRSLARLRALSVGPCFFMGDRFSLTLLARVCARLQELDVRANYVGIATCSLCRDGKLSLHPQQCRDTLPKKLISLERLTVSCTSQLNWFAFVNACDVAELRLCDRSSRLSDVALDVLLTGNRRLFSLLLDSDGLRLDDAFRLRDLAKAPNLRYLCLLSNIGLWREAAEAAACTLVRTLPALRTLHVHFRNTVSAELERMSWTRRGYGHRCEPRRYKATTNSPCVLCPTSTFIGLAKPRYQFSGGL
ncbi:hypothetical protein HPB50_020088 [Hyalomma asiaticum]|uniref:Uncharacterized protein n=1 Tax=Hyalomma asiaticum TaxID=266040 RepID=A0ACB7RKH8_HYAAI|nr:hypothetical protein HPB50_020088 [Hyalomma asiaticum]